MTGRGTGGRCRPPVRRDHRYMRTRSRPPLLLLLATVLLAALAPSASAATLPSETAIAAAEKGALTLTNKRRTDRGLIALQWDTRLGSWPAIERVHGPDRNLFAHPGRQEPVRHDDRARHHLVRRRRDYRLEHRRGRGQSKDVAVQELDRFPAAQVIVLSTGLNYVGFGLAISPTTGQRYWAGVYLKGPDRTGAWSTIESVTKARSTRPCRG